MNTPIPGITPALHDIFAAFRSWMQYRMNTESAMDSLPPEEWMEGMMLQTFLAGVSVGATLTKRYPVEELLAHNISASMPYGTKQ